MTIENAIAQNLFLIVLLGGSAVTATIFQGFNYFADRKREAHLERLYSGLPDSEKTEFLRKELFSEETEEEHIRKVLSLIPEEQRVAFYRENFGPDA